MSGATLTDLNNWIDAMMKHKKFSNYEMDISGNSFKGDGYLGEVTFLKVNATTGKKHEKCYNLVVKSAKKDDEFRKKTPIKLAYDREIFMYTKIFPMFFEFQLERNIEKPYIKFAKCYSVCSEDKKEALVLQNLKSLGYDIHDRTRPQNLNHALMVFQNYAKFHAISFAMRHMKPSLFKSMTKNMCDVMKVLIEQTNLIETFHKDFRFAVDLLRKSEGSEFVRKFDRFNEKEIERILTTLKDPESPQSVLTHGDCWNNNMMFKYEDGNKTKPAEMMFLDFQLSTIGSPVCDLSYYLYSCADNTVLQHFDFLLQAYYSSLTDSLKEFGCEPEDIITLKELKSHWKKYGEFGLAMCPFIIKLELCDSSEVVDLADSANEDYNKAFDMKIRNQDEYEKRLRDVFRHFAKKFL